MDYPKSLADVYLHNGKFTDGTADGAIEPSRDPADWANAVTDEILAVQTAGGLVADEANHTQLRDAIQALIAAAIGAISVKQKSLIATGQTFAPGVANGDPVRWDAGNSRWTKAQADGTANDLGLGLADVTNAEVVLYGETRAGLVAGLTPGAAYYLSGGGALTTTSPTDKVKVGVAKTATVLFVDVDAGLPAGVAYLGAAQAWSKTQSSTPVTITDGASPAIDLSASNVQTWTLGANRTCPLPTNIAAGTSGAIWLIQDGTGGRTLAYNSIWKFSGGVPPSLSTPAGAKDLLCWEVDPTGTAIGANLLKGFA